MRFLGSGLCWRSVSSEIVHWDTSPAASEYQAWLHDVRCDEPDGYIYYAWAWADDTSVVWLPLVTHDE